MIQNQRENQLENECEFKLQQNRWCGRKLKKMTKI